VTVVDALWPLPSPLLATTEYVAGPVVVLLAVHVGPLELQLVHWKLLGDCVHDAVSVTLPPTTGVGLFAVNVQDGGAVGGCCQATVTCAVLPTPAELRPETA
jgi:hypothetical protein